MAVGEITETVILGFGGAFGEPIGDREASVDIVDLRRGEVSGDGKEGVVVPLEEALVDGLDVAFEETAKEAPKPTKERGWWGEWSG